MIRSPRCIQPVLFTLFFVIFFPYFDAHAQLRYEIPLTMRAGLPSIEAKLPGENTSLWFVFDTGADINVIEKQVAKRLKLDDSNGEKIVVNKTIEDEVVNLTNIGFGNFTIPKLELASVNFNSPTTIPEKYIDGILGQDVLRDFDVTLDAPAHKLILEKPISESKRFEGAQCFANAIGWLRSLNEPRGIYADILLPHKDKEGQFVRVHALVDTGAAITILNWLAAKEIGITPGDPSLVEVKGGLKGLDPNRRSKAYFYEMPMVKFGASQITAVKVVISDNPGFGLHGMDETPAVLLGIDVLKQQRLAISKGAGRLCFGD